jgi:hypothetical protein
MTNGQLSRLNWKVYEDNNHPTSFLGAKRLTNSKLFKRAFKKRLT